MFAGVVAHDLRNPLAAIDGWTEMIADELDGGDLDPDLAREFVSRVRSSSRRMRELIRDLLAHATSGSRDLDHEPDRPRPRWSTRSPRPGTPRGWSAASRCRSSWATRCWSGRCSTT